MNDIHIQSPGIALPVDVAGVKNLKAQFIIMDRTHGVQRITASVDFLCRVPTTQRGVHMSRFIEILNEWHYKPISLDKLIELLKQCTHKLETRFATIAVKFCYFMPRESPVSCILSQVPLDVMFHASFDSGGPVKRLIVTVPVFSVCPCAGHQQRTLVTIDLIYKEFVWIEEIAELVWDTASGPVYPLLKREDEICLVTAGQQRPMFVEDLVREIYTRLRSDPRIVKCSVTAESFESIHAHNAVARIGDVRRTITHLREEIW